jgi:hypothetical protein
MKKADNFDSSKWLVENKITFQSRLNEAIDFPEMEDEFRGAMETGDYTKEEYLQDIISASPNELVSDAYYEVSNAIKQGTYTKPEAVKLMKAWAKEKLGSPEKSEGSIWDEDGKILMMKDGVKQDITKVYGLVEFIGNHSKEIADKIGAVNIFQELGTNNIDNLGDASATAIYMVDGDRVEGGLAFRYPEDVDDDFVGENGDEPRPITVAGKKLMYVGYNI